MPRKKTGLASSTKKRYIKSTCHCLILCQNIVGGLYTIISEGKFTQSSLAKLFYFHLQYAKIGVNSFTIVTALLGYNWRDYVESFYFRSVFEL